MAGAIPIGSMPVDPAVEALAGSSAVIDEPLAGDVEDGVDLDPANAAAIDTYEALPDDVIMRDNTRMPVANAILQLGAGTSFSEVRKALPQIARDGFDAIQFAPLHVPGNTPFERDGEVKLGSVYAPTDYERIAPYAYGKGSIADFLYGPRVSYPEVDGWRALRAFVQEVHKAGIPHVIADVVFAHTFRSPETVAKFREKFGDEVYLRDSKQPDGIALVSGLESTGKAGPWFDAAPFNFEGPAAKALLTYQVGVMMRYVRNGITGFRFDAGDRLLAGGHLGKLVTAVRRQAAKEGYPIPFFYAEVLGTPIETVLRAIEEGRVDAVNSSVHWWGRPDDKTPWGNWVVDQQNLFMESGAQVIGFSTNADTDVLPDPRELGMKILLAWAMGPYSYFQGADQGRKNSVFLPKVLDAGATRVYFDEGEKSPVRSLLETINRLKDEPVFANDLPLDMHARGALIYMSKVDPVTGQWAQIVVNCSQDGSWDRDTILLPLGNKTVVYSNNGHVDVLGPRWRGDQFKLGPLGIAVFFGPSEHAATKPHVPQGDSGGKYM